MKNKNKLIGLVRVLVCLILCVSMTLSGCVRVEPDDGNQPQPSSDVEESGGSAEEPIDESTEATEESTEETTEATEETTEATEETTEESTDPSEEETEPEDEDTSTGGNTRPGGTGGFTGGTVNSGTGGDSTEDDSSGSGSGSATENTVAAPGTETNAYTEYVSTLPDAVGSVKIPANGTICYNLYLTEASVLTIADADAYIVCNGVTYDADANGLVTVSLTPAEDGTPISFQLGNKGSAEEAYAMNFAAPLGTAANPEEIMFVEQISVTIGADNRDGYYYTWTAVEDGTLSLTVESINPEDAQCDILLTLGETSVSLSESEDGTVSIEMAADDTVTIQVVVKPEGIEAQVAISGVFAPGFGTASNPYVETVWEMPGSFETVEINAGKEKYYSVYYVGGSVLTIEDPNAYVIYNGVVYTAYETGVVTILLESGDPRLPVSLVIGNSGENAQAYTVTFTPPVGSYANPLPIEDITEVTLNVPEGSSGGYFLRWTAPNDGLLSLEAFANPETVGFDVILTNMNSYAMAWLSDGSPVTMEVAEGDEVLIQIAVEPDMDWNYPAAEIIITGTFTIAYGTEKNPYTAVLTELPGSIETVEIEAGKGVYYEISNVSGTIMTIQDPDVYVIYNGITYTADKTGVLTLEVEASSSRTPVSIQIGNNGETAEQYTLNFMPTTGSVSNPEMVYSLFKLNTNLKAGNSGYYYSYTATQDGAVSFWVDEESSTKVPYDIILTSTGSFSAVALSESANGTVSMAVKEGDVVTIQVTTVSGTGSNPAGYLAVRGAAFTGAGSANDPYMTTVTEIPGGLATVDIPNGGEICYSIYRIGDTILTIEDEEAYVIYNGVTYSAVNGVVTVEIPVASAMAPTSLTIGNYYTAAEQEQELENETEAYLIRIKSPVGSYGNPEVLEDITSFTAQLKEGNTIGYYFHWTAQTAGTLTFRIESITDGVTGDIVLTSTGSYSQATLHGSEDGTVSIDVEAGNVVTILVSTIPDDSWMYPAATITVNGTFTAAGAEPEETPAAESETEPAAEPELTPEPETQMESVTPDEEESLTIPAEPAEESSAEAPAAEETAPEEPAAQDTVTEESSEAESQPAAGEG